MTQIYRARETRIENLVVFITLFAISCLTATGVAAGKEQQQMAIREALLD